MSDITFSMSADEKDVTKALQNLIKENAKLRSEIQKGVDEQKVAAKQEQEWAKLREKNAKDAAQQMNQLNSAAARIRESVASPFELASKKVAELRDHLQAGRLSTDEYRRAYANVAKELKEATRDHEAEARAAKAAAEVKAEALRKVAEAEREHTAAVREATAITDKMMTKEERYSANIAKLNTLRDKGVLGAQAHARAVAQEEKSLKGSGDATASLTAKMGQFVAGFASMSAAIALIRSEYDALIERQGKSRDANIGLAAQQEALLMNLGGADAGGVLKNIRQLSQRSGVKEENITTAVNDAMAARADLGVDQVVNAVGSVSKIRKLAPAEMAGLAAATIDTQKQTGLGTDQSLGFLLQLQGQARTKNLKSLAENMTPAVGGVMNFGADRQTAGALLAALSHGTGDTTGAMSATAAIQLSKQLRGFAPGQDIGQSIEMLQANPELRQKFMANASFEAKALPAIESLFNGGTQAKQFAAARTALSADPMQALQDAIRSRGASPALGVAELDQTFANSIDQQRLQNPGQARSAVIRDRLAELRLSMGRGRLATQASTILEDLQTSGDQGIPTALQGLRGLVGSELNSSIAAGADQGLSQKKVVANFEKENAPLLLLIEELKKLNVTNEKQLAAQQQGAHAGVAAGRRNNQGEAGP